MSASGYRALLVGECNPRGSDPQYALYPEPAGCSGARLAQILGMTGRDYLAVFARANLCDRRWSLPEARERARLLLRTAGTPSTPIVVLGVRVAAAFGLPTQPFKTHLVGDPRHLHADRVVGTLPHPSGRCRVWSEPGAVDRARELVSVLTQVTRERPRMYACPGCGLAHVRSGGPKLPAVVRLFCSCGTDVTDLTYQADR